MESPNHTYKLQLHSGDGELLSLSECAKMASPSSSSEKGADNGKPPQEAAAAAQKVKKEGLGWIEWLMGWFYLAYEMLFQRIVASNVPNPMPLPPINDLTFIVTGSTSGIGKEIARFFFATDTFFYGFNGWILCSSVIECVRVHAGGILSTYACFATLLCGCGIGSDLGK